MTKGQHFFNDSVKARLPKRNITHIDAKVIVANMSDHFGLGFVDVDFDTKNRADSLGKASKKKGQVIYLYGVGLNLGTLLHEIAHIMPDGMNHDGRWQQNFVEAVNVYLENPDFFHTINW